MKATTIGIDLAKSVFQLHGVDGHGKALPTGKLETACPPRIELAQRLLTALPYCFILYLREILKYKSILVRKGILVKRGNRPIVKNFIILGSYYGIFVRERIHKALMSVSLDFLPVLKKISKVHAS